MEYTVQQLADLAGISGRTLRYYDQIGLLKPARISPAGYRLYGPAEVDRLQQILFYRSLGVKLELIKEIIDSPSFDELAALREHRAKLLEEKVRIEKLIATVEKTIAAKERRITMSDREKFEGFKQQLIEENERKYGKEIREKYGDEAVERSIQAFLNMSEEEYKEFTELSNRIIESLLEAMETGDPAGEAAQRTADLHRQWITKSWGWYDKDAHAGLAMMYVDDPRFSEYYDKHRPGAAEFLRDAILVYTGKQS